LRNALLALLPDHFGAASLKHLHEQLHSRPAACLRILHSS
jgi:hypothetical protein